MIKDNSKFHKEKQKKTKLGCFRGSSGYHGLRTTSSDWSENASNGTHYWYEYEGSAMCNLTTPDKDCVSLL